MSEQIRQAVKKLSHSERLRKIILFLLIVILGLGLILPIVEAGARAKIVTAWDGIYFAVTTVTGVGYGDLVPISDAGRVIAMLLQTLGVVLFGAIVASVSVEILRYQEDYYVRRILSRIDELETKLDEMKKHLDYLVKK